MAMVIEQSHSWNRYNRSASTAEGYAAKGYEVSGCSLVIPTGGCAMDR